MNTAPGWKEAYAGLNLWKMWKITEEVVLGSGGISAYTLTVKLIKTKQEEDFSSYVKEFNEVVKNLDNQGTPYEILNIIKNTLFILGLN